MPITDADVGIAIDTGWHTVMFFIQNSFRDQLFEVQKAICISLQKVHYEVHNRRINSSGGCLYAFGSAGTCR
jgi:hypothetical protein